MFPDQRAADIALGRGNVPIRTLVKTLRQEHRDINKVIELLQRIQQVRLRRKRFGNPVAPIAHALAIAAAATGRPAAKRAPLEGR